MKKLIILLILLLLSVLPVYAEDEVEETEAESPVFTQGEVVVSAKKPPAQTVSSTEEITEEDIRAMGATNVAEALQWSSSARVDLAPTSISANGKQEYLVSLRGFDPRNVIVMIDGIPVYEPYFHVIDLRQLPVAGVAKIKIIKGPSSVLYGPNSIGGIINIITKKGAGPLQGNLDVRYGDVNDLNGQAQAYGQTNGFHYFFGTGGETSDGFPVSDDFEQTRNEDGGLRENSDFRDIYATGKMGYEGMLGTVTATASHYDFDGGVPFSMEAIEPGTLWRKRWEKTSAALYGDIAPTDYFYGKAALFYTRFYNTITTFEDTNMAAVVDEGDGVSTFDNHIAGFQLFPSFILGRYGVLTASALYKLDSANTQREIGAEWYRYEGENYSGALQYELSLAGFSLTTGAAMHLFRRTKTPQKVLGDDDTAFDFQAAAAYEIFEWFSLRAGWAKKSAFPDLRTLYGSFGNPDLSTETAQNIDAGLQLSPWEPLFFEATWFYSKIDDLIGEKDTGNTVIFENIDEAVIQGVESRMDLQFFDKRLQLGGSHTYLATEDRRENRELDSLDFRPEQKATFHIRTMLPLRFFIAGQYFYTGERKYQTPNGIETLPEYGLVNARIAKSFLFDNDRRDLSIYVEGKNLFDTYYETSPQKASPGRMLYSGLSFAF